jgi:hypothetical protein
LWNDPAVAHAERLAFRIRRLRRSGKVREGSIWVIQPAIKILKAPLGIIEIGVIAGLTSLAIIAGVKAIYEEIPSEFRVLRRDSSCQSDS